MNTENTLSVYSIDELLIKYRMLNKTYQEIIYNHRLEFDQQCLITDFYNVFNKEEYLEKAILHFIRTTDKENTQFISSHLKNTINENIELYLNNNKFLDDIDTDKVCDNRPNSIHFKIKIQEKYTNEKSIELRDIRNSLESASWNNERERVEFLEKEEKRIKELYKIEQNNLDFLYKQEREFKVYTSNYSENIFNKIYDLNFTFLKSLSDYFLDKAEENTNVPKDELVERVYFDMELVSKIHKVCNGVQFENLTEIDFYSLLNLHHSKTKLNIKYGEKERVYFLISKLHKHIETKDDKLEWRTAILEYFKIDFKTYKSKYLAPASETASKESKEFVTEINAIFKNIY